MHIANPILQDFENMQREIEEYKQGIAQEEKKTAEAEKKIELLGKRLAEFEKV
jgi:hypothetical protein